VRHSVPSLPAPFPRCSHQASARPSARGGRLCTTLHRHEWHCPGPCPCTRDRRRRSRREQTEPPRTRARARAHTHGATGGSDVERLFCLVDPAVLDHVAADGHDLLLLNLARRLLRHELLADDLVPPLERLLLLLERRVLLPRHRDEPLLRLEDGAGHPLVETVLEHALSHRRVQPRADDGVGLPVAPHLGHGIPHDPALVAAVEIEVGGAFWWRIRRTSLLLWHHHAAGWV